MGEYKQLLCIITVQSTYQFHKVPTIQSILVFQCSHKWQATASFFFVVKRGKGVLPCFKLYVLWNHGIDVIRVCWKDEKDYRIPPREYYTGYYSSFNYIRTTPQQFVTGEFVILTFRVRKFCRLLILICGMTTEKKKL